MADEFDVRLKTPFSLVLAGPSGAGKTHFLTELLVNHKVLIDREPDVILYLYGEYLQDTFNKLKRIFGDKINFVKGLNFEIEQFDGKKNNFIIIDDLIQEAVVSREVNDLFTRASHHRSINVILISQNIFCQGPFSVSINRNAHYVVVFKSPRDVSQLNCLAKQIMPGKTKVILDSYKDSTLRNHGYLLLDFKQSTPDNLRLRTNILPSEAPQFVYVAK